MGKLFLELVLPPQYNKGSLMDLNKLRTFLLVAELGSISKTAEKLNRTQPAITQQMQLLEEEIQLRLFDRKNTRIYLTAEGEEIYQFALKRILELDEKVSKIHNKTKQMEGIIRLSLSPDSAILLAPIIQQFEQKYPKVHIRFNICHEGHVENELIQNDADFGVVSLPRERKLLEATPFLEEPLHLVTSPKYLQKIEQMGLPLNEFQDILSLNLLEYDDKLLTFCTFFKENKKDLIPKLAKIDPYIIAESPLVIRDFLLKGLGIAVIQETLIKKDLESGDLLSLFPQKTKTVSQKTYLLTKKKRTHSFVKQELYQFITHFYL